MLDIPPRLRLVLTIAALGIARVLAARLRAANAQLVRSAAQSDAAS